MCCCACFGAGALPVLKVTLPIGISFYTFHSMSYMIDVYRGAVQRARSFSDLSCFVGLFPHLVAGPIIRYNMVADQLASREHTLERFTPGIAMFILGFAKKILLANPMGTVADAVFAAQSPLALDAWVGVVAYAFQIYFDFSGYSDMAVGLGRMFGFEIPEELRLAVPGRKHHRVLAALAHLALHLVARLSLHSAGRQPKGTAPHLRQPGGGHAPGRPLARRELDVRRVGRLSREPSGLRAVERKDGALRWLPRGARVAFTFLLVLISWVLFRSPTITAAMHYLGAMAGANSSPGPTILLGAEIYTPYSLVILGLCALLSFQRLEVYDWVEGLDGPRAFALVPLFLLAIAAMFTQGLNPFLYFQF